MTVAGQDMGFIRDRTGEQLGRKWKHSEPWRRGSKVVEIGLRWHWPSKQHLVPNRLPQANPRRSPARHTWCPRPHPARAGRLPHCPDTPEQRDKAMSLVLSSPVRHQRAARGFRVPDHEARIRPESARRAVGAQQVPHPSRCVECSRAHQTVQRCRRGQLTLSKTAANGPTRVSVPSLAMYGTTDHSWSKLCRAYAVERKDLRTPDRYRRRVCARIRSCLVHGSYATEGRAPPQEL